MIDSHVLLSGDGQFVSADSLGPTCELFPVPTWIHPGSTRLTDPAYDAMRLLEVDVPDNLRSLGVAHCPRALTRTGTCNAIARATCRLAKDRNPKSFDCQCNYVYKLAQGY